jgi:hypothetical protein
MAVTGKHEVSGKPHLTYRRDSVPDLMFSDKVVFILSKTTNDIKITLADMCQLRNSAFGVASISTVLCIICNTCII